MRTWLDLRLIAASTVTFTVLRLFGWPAAVFWIVGFSCGYVVARQGWEL